MLVLCAALGRSRGARLGRGGDLRLLGRFGRRGVFPPHPAGHGPSAVDPLGGRAADRLAGLPPRGARGPLRSRLSGRRRLHDRRGDRLGRSLDCARGRAARRPPARRSSRGGRRARSARRGAPDRGDGAVDPAHQPGGARDDARRRPALLDPSLEAARARRAAPARWSHLGARRSPALGTSAPQRSPERDLSDALRRGVRARRGVSGLEVAVPRRPLRARSSLPVSRGGGVCRACFRRARNRSSAPLPLRNPEKLAVAATLALALLRGDRLRRLAGAASAGTLRARAPGRGRGVRRPRGLRRASAGTRRSSRHLPDPRRPGPRPARRGQPSSRALGSRPSLDGDGPGPRRARRADAAGPGRGAGASDAGPGGGEPPHRPFVHGGGSLRSHRLRAVRRSKRSRGRVPDARRIFSASSFEAGPLAGRRRALGVRVLAGGRGTSRRPCSGRGAPFSTRTSTRAIFRASRVCASGRDAPRDTATRSVFFGALGLRYGIRFRDQEPIAGYREVGGDALQAWDENAGALSATSACSRRWREAADPVEALGAIPRLGGRRGRPRERSVGAGSRPRRNRSGRRENGRAPDAGPGGSGPDLALRAPVFLALSHARARRRCPSRPFRRSSAFRRVPIPAGRSRLVWREELPGIESHVGAHRCSG